MSGIVLGQDKNLAGISVGFYNQNCPAEYKQPFLFSSMNTEFSVVNNLANGKISIIIGSYLAYANGRYSKDETIFNFTNRVLGVRSVFRYRPTRLIEVYGGLMSGYDFAYVKTDNSINTNYEGKGIFAWASFVGLGFNVLKNFAITTELSVGMASMNIGVAYRF